MSKHAVILYTIGSPENLDPACIRDYINRFLSDKLVVKLPRFLWQPILRNMILKSRPQRLVGRYDKIFVDGKNPYLRDMEQLCSELHTLLTEHNQAAAQAKRAQGTASEVTPASVATAAATSFASIASPSASSFFGAGGFAGNDSNVLFDASMCKSTAARAACSGENVEYVVVPAYAYTGDGLKEIASALISKGFGHITVIPLFPQYSDTTSKRPRLELEELKKSFPQATFAMVRSYSTNDFYISSVASMAAQSLADPRSHLLLTYHSLPKTYITLGDPYLNECRNTSDAIFRQLGLDDTRSSIAFQSKMGPMPWLQPYLEEHVDALLAKGVTRLVVMAPGFSTDCLETLYDIDINLREQFMNHGGESFSYIPCLNATAQHTRLMARLLMYSSEDL